MGNETGLALVAVGAGPPRFALAGAGEGVAESAPERAALVAAAFSGAVVAIKPLDTVANPRRRRKTNMSGLGVQVVAAGAEVAGSPIKTIDRRGEGMTVALAGEGVAVAVIAPTKETAHREVGTEIARIEGR